MDLLVDLANLIEDSNQIAKCQECSRRKNEQQNVCNLWKNLYSEERTCTNQFTYTTQKSQCERKS